MIDCSTFKDLWPNGKPIERVVFAKGADRFISFKSPLGDKLSMSLAAYNSGFCDLWNWCIDTQENVLNAQKVSAPGDSSRSR